MEPDVPNPVIDASLQEAMARGQSFEVITNTEGWGYIKAYIENAIQSFATKAIKDGFTSFDEYQLERGKVLGLNSLLANIENDLRILNDQRQVASQPTE